MICLFSRCLSPNFVSFKQTFSRQFKFASFLSRQNRENKSLVKKKCFTIIHYLGGGGGGGSNTFYLIQTSPSASAIVQPNKQLPRIQHTNIKHFTSLLPILYCLLHKIYNEAKRSALKVATLIAYQR